MHYDGGKHQTRILEQNIHNLVYGRFEITNEYGFPNMYPVHIDNLENIRSKKKLDFNFKNKGSMTFRNELNNSIE